MAQLIEWRRATPRQDSKPAGNPPPSGDVGGPAAVAPANRPEDRSWFGSSWELHKGVDVAELQDLPQEFCASKPVVFTIRAVDIDFDIDIEPVNALG